MFYYHILLHFGLYIYVTTSTITFAIITIVEIYYSQYTVSLCFEYIYFGCGYTFFVLYITSVQFLFVYLIITFFGLSISWLFSRNHPLWGSVASVDGLDLYLLYL